MAKKQTIFEILNIPPNSSAGEVFEKYQQYRKDHHPDGHENGGNGKRAAEEQLAKDANEAYQEYTRDPHIKAQMDQYRAERKKERNRKAEQEQRAKENAGEQRSQKQSQGAGQQQDQDRRQAEEQARQQQEQARRQAEEQARQQQRTNPPPPHDTNAPPPPPPHEGNVPPRTPNESPGGAFRNLSKTEKGMTAAGFVPAMLQAVKDIQDGHPGQAALDVGIPAGMVVGVKTLAPKVAPLVERFPMLTRFSRIIPGVGDAAGVYFAGRDALDSNNTTPYRVLSGVEAGLYGFSGVNALASSTEWTTGVGAAAEVATIPLTVIAQSAAVTITAGKFVWYDTNWIGHHSHTRNLASNNQATTSGSNHGNSSPDWTAVNIDRLKNWKDYGKNDLDKIAHSLHFANAGEAHWALHDLNLHNAEELELVKKAAALRPGQSVDAYVKQHSQNGHDAPQDARDELTSAADKRKAINPHSRDSGTTQQTKNPSTSEQAKMHLHVEQERSKHTKHRQFVAPPTVHFEAGHAEMHLAATPPDTGAGNAFSDTVPALSSLPLPPIGYKANYAGLRNGQNFANNGEGTGTPMAVSNPTSVNLKNGVVKTTAVAVDESKVEHTRVTEQKTDASQSKLAVTNDWSIRNDGKKVKVTDTSVTTSEGWTRTTHSENDKMMWAVIRDKEGHIISDMERNNKGKLVEHVTTAATGTKIDVSPSASM